MSTASRRWAIWSTTAQVVVTEPPDLDAARNIVQTILAEVDQACSRFRADSEIRALEAPTAAPAA